MNPLITFYDRLIEKYGPNDPRALNWRNAESQERRFQVLTEIENLENASILDAGCGVGDLYDFLRCHVRQFSYEGIDINKNFIESARTKYPGITFGLMDVAKYEGVKSDYSFASGLLSFKTSNHKELYFGYIKRIFDLSNKGVAFNMLNIEHHDDNETYAAYSVGEVHNFCSGLTGKIKICQDYLPYDFTVYLYH
ncbi:MAG: class I SAM-dependent methyltransferase [bacterium]|nr:class I SAM-dependent methyltransferase [bacterium]